MYHYALTKAVRSILNTRRFNPGCRLSNFCQRCFFLFSNTEWKRFFSIWEKPLGAPLQQEYIFCLNIKQHIFFWDHECKWIFFYHAQLIYIVFCFNNLFYSDEHKLSLLKFYFVCTCLKLYYACKHDIILSCRVYKVKHDFFYDIFFVCLTKIRNSWSENFFVQFLFLKQLIL